MAKGISHNRDQDGMKADRSGGLDKSSPMRKQQREDLADYVRRIRTTKGLSLKDVERRSSKGISSGYVSQIENRYVLNVTPDKLRGLAKGLGVPEDEVFAFARSASPGEDPDFRESLLYMLYEKSKDASRDKQKFIDEIIRMLLDRIDRDQIE